MVDTLCHVLQCTTLKETTKCIMYGNSCMDIKSDALSATTTRKHKYRKKTVPVASHAMGCLTLCHGFGCMPHNRR